MEIYVNGLKLSNPDFSQFINCKVAIGGCFDLLHHGHISLFSYVLLKHGNYVVLMNSDESVRSLKGQRRPLFSFEQRASVVSMLKGCEGVIRFDELSPTDVLLRLRPLIFVKGEEYKTRYIEEREHLITNCITVDYAPFAINVSSTEIVRKIEEKLNG